MHPAFGEAVGAVKLDGARSHAFRDHPDVARMGKDMRIREVARPLQNRTGYSRRSVLAECRRRDDSATECVIEFLAEEVQNPLRYDQERIGLIAPAIARRRSTASLSAGRAIAMGLR